MPWKEEAAWWWGHQAKLDLGGYQWPRGCVTWFPSKYCNGSFEDLPEKLDIKDYITCRLQVFPALTSPWRKTMTDFLWGFNQAATIGRGSLLELDIKNGLLWLNTHQVGLMRPCLTASNDFPAGAELDRWLVSSGFLVAFSSWQFRVTAIEAFELQSFFWSAWFTSWLGWIKKKGGEFPFHSNFGRSLLFFFLYLCFVTVSFFWSPLPVTVLVQELSNLTDKQDLLIHTGFHKRAFATEECCEIDLLPSLDTRITRSSCLLSVKAWDPPPPPVQGNPS